MTPPSHLGLLRPLQLREMAITVQAGLFAPPIYFPGTIWWVGADVRHGCPAKGAVTCSLVSPGAQIQSYPARTVKQPYCQPAHSQCLAKCHPLPSCLRRYKSITTRPAYLRLLQSYALRRFPPKGYEPGAAAGDPGQLKLLLENDVGGYPGVDTTKAVLLVGPLIHGP